MSLAGSPNATPSYPSTDHDPDASKKQGKLSTREVYSLRCILAWRKQVDPKREQYDLEFNKYE